MRYLMINPFQIDRDGFFIRVEFPKNNPHIIREGYFFRDLRQEDELEYIYYMNKKSIPYVKPIWFPNDETSPTDKLRNTFGNIKDEDNKKKHRDSESSIKRNPRKD